MRVLFLLLISCSLQALSIIFVHVGSSSLPEHLSFSIAQARLFNPNCPIYLIAPQTALEGNPFGNEGVTLVPCESLRPSFAHKRFLASPSHLNTAGGFWIYTTERFFYLEEFVRLHHLTDVFHLENDMMLYVDLQKMLPLFHKHYSGMIATTFEKDNRCIPGFVYIATPQPLERLIQFFPYQIEEGNLDTITLAKFKEQYRGLWIELLPIIIPAYIENEDPEIFKGKTISPYDYTHHFDDFQSVFDAAAFGVYAAGWDAKFHEECQPGVVSSFCIFDASRLPISWSLDEAGRRVPSFTYRGKKVRINNLHITNKGKISLFSSTRAQI